MIFYQFFLHTHAHTNNVDLSEENRLFIYRKFRPIQQFNLFYPRFYLTLFYFFFFVFLSAQKFLAKSIRHVHFDDEPMLYVCVFSIDSCTFYCATPCLPNELSNFGQDFQLKPSKCLLHGAFRA